jgi:hypothetical protein
MPFVRRLKSIGQATVILLALGPLLPLSFFSEICEAAIERLLKRTLARRASTPLNDLRSTMGGRNCCRRAVIGALSMLRVSEQGLEALLALGFFALVLLFLWPTL